MDIKVHRKYLGSPHQLLCLPQCRLLRQDSRTHHRGTGGAKDIRSLCCESLRGQGVRWGRQGSVAVRMPRATVSSHQGHMAGGHPGCREDPPSGAVGLATSSPSAPSAKPSCEALTRGRGEQRFSPELRRRGLWLPQERSPRSSELLSSWRHASMNNRSSPDAGRLLCNFSRRLESLRVLAEVTACLSYSGWERQSSAGGDEMPTRRHLLSSVGLAWAPEALCPATPAHQDLAHPSLVSKVWP